MTAKFLALVFGPHLAMPSIVVQGRQSMNDWKKVGCLLVASAAVLSFAGAGGRSSAWATANGEGQVPEVEQAQLRVEQTPTAADAQHEMRAESIRVAR
jgi:hypothetical protein